MTAPIGAAGATQMRGAQSPQPATPPRGLPTLAPPGDFVSMLAAAQLAMRDTRASQEKTCADSAAHRRDESLEKAREAEQAAIQAQRAADEAAKKSSLFKTIGVGAGLVAATAAVCFTAGASAPAIIALAGVLLSASSSKIGDELGKDWGTAAQWTGFGLSLAGGIGSIAMAGSTAATAATSRGVIETSARLVEAGANGASGVEKAVSQSRDGDAVDAHADALAARTTAKAAQADQDQVIELLRVAEKAARKGMQAIMAMSNDVESTHRLEASMGRGMRA